MWSLVIRNVMFSVLMVSIVLRETFVMRIVVTGNVVIGRAGVMVCGNVDFGRVITKGVIMGIVVTGADSATLGAMIFGNVFGRVITKRVIIGIVDIGNVF